MKIYTKTGDEGQTSLWGGKRVSKHHIRIESYGTLDELNAYIGLVADASEHVPTSEYLRGVQSLLFTAGAILATPTDAPAPKNMEILESDILSLEQQIDEMEAVLTPLQNFILAGGHPTVSFTHLARTVCRRAERLVVLLQDSDPHPLNLPILKYLNRLSDYLFVLARWLGKNLGAVEQIWKGRS
jgi:cob(I)alamin adenosyltransferase